MAHNPVGDNVVLAVTTSSAQSASLPQQSDTLRVVNTGHSGVHVAIGSTPVATTANYFVESNEKAVISLLDLKAFFSSLLPKKAASY